MIFEKPNSITITCLVGLDGTPRHWKFLTLDQKIEIIVSFDAGMKTSAIALFELLLQDKTKSISLLADHHICPLILW